MASGVTVTAARGPQGPPRRFLDLWVMRGRHTPGQKEETATLPPALPRKRPMQCPIPGGRRDGQTDDRGAEEWTDYSSLRDENLRKFSIRPSL